MWHVRQWWRTYIWIALVAVSLIWFVAGSRSFQNCVSSSPQNQEPKSPKEGAPYFVQVMLPLYRRCAAEYIVTNNPAINALGTVLIALFTIVLAGFARRQSETAKILQRAYLSVEAGGIAPYASPTDIKDKDWRVVAHISVRNAGNLPARNVRYHFNTEFSTDEFWSEERLATIDKKGKDSGASGPTGNNVIPPGGTMNQGGPTRYLAERGWVYVWGIVTYHDGFEPDRIIRFCHRYNLKRLKPGKDGMRRIKPKYGRHYEKGWDAT